MPIYLEAFGEEYKISSDGHDMIEVKRIEDLINQLLVSKDRNQNRSQDTFVGRRPKPPSEINFMGAVRVMSEDSLMLPHTAFPDREMESHEKFKLAKAANPFVALIIAAKWMESCDMKCRPREYDEVFKSFLRIFRFAQNDRVPFLRAYKDPLVKSFIDEICSIKSCTDQARACDVLVRTFLLSWARGEAEIDILASPVWDAQI